MKQIDILDLFDALSDYVSDPTNKEAADKVADFKSKMVIRNFLPLAQKEAVMLKTLYDIRAVDTEAQHFVSALEVSLTFNGLMAYVVNIDYDIQQTLKDEIFYDVFWVSGMGDYILSFCEKDYNRVKDMVTNVYDYKDVQQAFEDAIDPVKKTEMIKGVVKVAE